MPLNIPEGWRMADLPETDPVFKEYEFCEECEPKILNIVAHCREQENVINAARQAILAIGQINTRLEESIAAVKRENGILKHQIEDSINAKGFMDKIDAQVHRSLVRDRITR